jgi:hypothetical protein
MLSPFTTLVDFWSMCSLYNPGALTVPRPPYAAVSPCSNLAVGGRYPGAPDGNTPFPTTFEIDYLRVLAK